MNADNNGVGVIFSLYAQVHKCGKWLTISAMIGGSAPLADGVAYLFSVQQAGTIRIDQAFGPVMLICFSFLGINGVLHILDTPAVLEAFNPVYAA